jgi:dTDP-4-dehydrorhamnose 3,5-epimerase
LGYFNFLQTTIKGLFVVESRVYADERGYFMELYNYQDFKEAGLDMVFVQDNQSLSQKGVLRGLHFQLRHPQGKLVRAVKGSIFDVAVDLRTKSPTFKQWFGIVLSEENKKQLYIPKGFAHGFLVTSDEAQLAYKCTDYYHPRDERGIIWNDPQLAINWPAMGIDKIRLSEKDKNLPPFASLELYSQLL